MKKNISKFSADALASMLAAEQRKVRVVVKADDGVELIHSMVGWSSDRWRKSADGVLYKKCPSCKQWHPLSEFPLARRINAISRDGRTSLCPKCIAQKDAECVKRGDEITVRTNDIKKIAVFSDAELLRELRLRGYKGQLTHTQIITV